MDDTLMNITFPNPIASFGTGTGGIGTYTMANAMNSSGSITPVASLPTMSAPTVTPSSSLGLLLSFYLISWSGLDLNHTPLPATNKYDASETFGTSETGGSGSGHETMGYAWKALSVGGATGVMTATLSNVIEDAAAVSIIIK
jgi:hypothetical protein